MRSALPLILIAALGTTGCARIAESRLNPLNLFKGNGTVQRDADGNVPPLVTQQELARPIDRRTLIATVDVVEVDRMPSGVVVRATGQAAGQGFYNAQLVPVSNADGVLRMEFRVQPPATQVAGRVQQITAARVVDASDLRGITQIVVQGAQTGRSVPR